MTTIIQIVPQLPPVVSGVGDYAIHLAQQIRQELGLDTQFLVGDSKWSGTAQVKEFSASCLGPHSPTELQSQLKKLTAHSDSIVLMHYVGYGYAKRGCPTWLIEGLEHWKKNPEARLVTMFHEVYASGPPWTSAFWLSPLQKNLATRLAKLSDRCLTSKQSYADILLKLSEDKHTSITVLPVFSTVGELPQITPLATRNKNLVIFGGKQKRQKVYKNSLEEINFACEALGIEKILDIGPPTYISSLNSIKVPVVELGSLPTSEIGSILSNSFAGFTDYPPNYLAKSTIFAAYCAYALLPVNPHSLFVSCDGINAGEQYWVPDKQTAFLNEVSSQKIASNAYNWYQKHNLENQATIFATQLNLKN